MYKGLGTRIFITVNNAIINDAIWSFGFWF